MSISCTIVLYINCKDKYAELRGLAVLPGLPSNGDMIAWDDEIDLTVAGRCFGRRLSSVELICEEHNCGGSLDEQIEWYTARQFTLIKKG